MYFLEPSSKATNSMLTNRDDDDTGNESARIDSPENTDHI